jgi:hypothetical protein
MDPMPGDPREVERLRRIRDQQLRTRDPLIKQRKLDYTIAAKHRKARVGFSFGRIWGEIPHRWRGLLVGGLIGVGALLAAPALIPGTWGTCIGLAAFPFAAMLGFLFGRYEDSEQDVKDLIP